MHLTYCVIHLYSIKPQILALTKLKAFAEDKFDDAKMISVFKMEENIVDNRKKLVTSIFAISHHNV